MFTIPIIVKIPWQYSRNRINSKSIYGTFICSIPMNQMVRMNALFIIELHSTNCSYRRTILCLPIGGCNRIISSKLPSHHNIYFPLNFQIETQHIHSFKCSLDAFKIRKIHAIVHQTITTTKSRISLNILGIQQTMTITTCTY